MLAIPIVGPDLKTAFNDIDLIIDYRKTYPNLVIELRWDGIKEYLKKPITPAQQQGLEKLIKHAQTAKLPIIYTNMTTKDNGGFEGTIEERAELLQTTLDTGVDYVSIEMDDYNDLLSRVQVPNTTNIIAMYHNDKETPRNLFEIYENLKKLKPDIIKIATKANNHADAKRIFDLICHAKNEGVSIIALPMGEPGVWVRSVGKVYGNLLAYCAIDEKRSNKAFCSFHKLLGVDKVFNFY